MTYLRRVQMMHDKEIWIIVLKLDKWVENDRVKYLSEGTKTVKQEKHKWPLENLGYYISILGMPSRA